MARQPPFHTPARGRLLTEREVSPLAVAPGETPRLAFYDYTAWKKHVDTYGPLWEYASGGVSLAVRGWLSAAEQWPGDEADCPRSVAGCRALMAYVTGYRLVVATIWLPMMGGALLLWVRAKKG